MATVKKATAKKANRKKRSSGRRASWKGNLTFGLITFPVEALNAINREQSDIHFHQLHAECHSRIRYQKICPIHGEVTQDEIVSGYEYKKGKYVEVEPEELDAVRTKQERALKIDTFIAPDAVDPLYYDGRMYYLLPDGSASEEPYAVIVEAMEREDRYGIGQLVFSGKEQLALVRPLEGVLHMAMLNYDEELRPAAEMAADKQPRAVGRKVELARTLIRTWSTDSFDFSAYDDPYRERIKELVDAKVEGREIVTPEEEEEPKIVNLMEALKQSLAVRGHSRKASVSRGRRKSG